MDLPAFDPAVAQWFREAFEAPTAAQMLGWQAISAGQHTLIEAPTGSGKTLAAFLWCVNELVAHPPKGPGVSVLYISPLKALNNDIQRNLQAPLAGIGRAAEALGRLAPDIRIQVRTGDTLPSERARQLRRPPDILITTPESLYLLLTSRKGAPMFSTVRYVIVDEIHALAGSKRGTHLALSLERLEEVVRSELAEQARARFVRIGLSATQRPLEAVAHLLGGWNEDGTPRPVSIVRAQEPKAIELDVVYPFADGAEQGEFMQQAARLVLEELPKHRSMLVFCNARHSCERLAELVNQLAEAPVAMAHHGSIARERRFQIEQDLKAGRLPLLITTSSLELGIDIGAVDFVLQLASPKSVNRAMQRLGRAGHAVGAASRGRIIARFPADLLDAAACARGVREHSIESTHIPAHCLDVLAQQIVAMAGWQAWPVAELLRVVRRADPFHSLSRPQLENVLAMLDGRYGDERFSDLRPRLVWDEEAGEVQPRPGSLRMALVNGGTIPDRGYFAVELEGEGAEPNRKVGEVDEEFASELYVGGRPFFALGTSVWGVQAVDRDRVLVRPAPGEMFQIPFWRGERLDRSIEYGSGRLTREVAARLDREPEAATVAWLEAACCLAPSAAAALLGYVRDQVEATGEVPSDRAIVVETFQDEIGDGRLVIHSLFGGRVNGAWAFALRPRLREALGGIDPLVLYNDDGIIVRLPPMDRQPPLEVLEQVRADTVEEFLIGELADAPMLALRFREGAQRALLLPRKQPGRRNPLWLRRQKAADLLSIVRRKMGFPVLQEAVRECLHDTWDLNGLRHVLRGMESGEIALTRRETASPSPFAASLVWEFGLAFAELGDAPRGECRAAYLSLNRDLLRETLETEDLRGLIDPVVLAEVEADLLRQAEQAGHDAELAALRGRAGRASGRKRVEALQLLLHRALQYLPPLAEVEIARRLDLEVAWTRRQLNVMVDASQLCRGEYRPQGRQPEYCVPRILARLHRDSLRRAREQIAPVGREQFAAFLPRWHGLGTDAAVAPRQALGRLRYLPLPRESWRAVLPARLGPAWEELVDGLTSRGALHWRGAGRGRVELVDAGAPARHRPAAGQEAGMAEARTLLAHRGALFASDAARLLAPTGLTPAQAAAALRALEDAGEAANDLFSGAGRWQLLNDGARFGRESAAKVMPDGHERRFGESRPSARAGARLSSAWLESEGGPDRAGAANADPAGDQASDDGERLELYAEALLQRYGVVAREVCSAERGGWPWAELERLLTSWEWRGRVLRGYFVHGLSGPQFALKEALERLRQEAALPLSHRPASPPGAVQSSNLPASTVILLPWEDPANAWAKLLPHPAPRGKGRFVGLADGAPALLMSGYGRDLLPLPAWDDALAPGLARALARLAFSTPTGRVAVERWATGSVLVSPVAAALGGAGFRRRGLRLAFQPSPAALLAPAV